MKYNVKAYDELNDVERTMFDELTHVLDTAEAAGKEDLAFHLEVAILYLLQREDRTKAKNMHQFSECVH